MVLLDFMLRGGFIPPNNLNDKNKWVILLLFWINDWLSILLNYHCFKIY
jgi:hypothetical protein